MYAPTDCELCPSLVSCRTQIVEGRGAPGYVMFVGEKPGPHEDKKGKAFIGDSGRLLALLSQAAGLAVGDLYLANAIRCLPPGNRRPKVKEIRACRPFLIEEIKAVKPAVIVSLGDVALQSTLGRAVTLGSVLGQTLTQPETGIPVVPTYHPAYLLRGQWQVADLVTGHMIKAREIADGERAELHMGEYETADTIEKLRALRDYLLHPDTREIATDTETSGLDWRKDELLCISFSTQPGEGFVVPILSHRNVPQPETPRGRKTPPPWPVDAHWDDKDWPEVLEILRQIFASDIKKVGQNLIFDVQFLERSPDAPYVEAATAFGFEINGQLEDTMLLHHAIAEAAMPKEARRTKRHSLTVLSAQYCVDDETEILTQRGWLRWDEVGTEDLSLGLNGSQSRTLDWQPILAVNQFPDTARTMISLSSRSLSILVTHDHRCIAAPRNKQGLRTILAADMQPDYVVPTAFPNSSGRRYVGQHIPALLGWYLTDGTDCLDGGIYLYQSEKNQPFCVEIIAHLEALARARHIRLSWAEHKVQQGCRRFYIRRKSAELLCRYAPGKRAPWEVLTDWESRSLWALWDAMVKGDGTPHSKNLTFKQKDKDRRDFFQALCVRLGIAATISNDQVVMRRPRRTGAQSKIVQRRIRSVQEIPYNGMVWCPTTPSGTWIARRNGRVFLTGNSDLPYYEEEINAATSNKRRMADAPDKVRHEYGAADADAVERVAIPLRAQAEAEGTLWASREIIQPLIRCCWEMEKRGAFVDIEWFDRLCKYYRDRIEEVEAELWAIELPETKPPWKYLHPGALQKVLFRELKLPPSGIKTDSSHGCEACDAGLCFEHDGTGKDALAIIEAQTDHPIIPVLRELRTLRKALSTSLDGGKGGFRRHIDPDSRARSQYRPGGAETGRLSSSDPDMQNVPKNVEIEELETTNAFRQIFSAPEGYGLMEADWSQLEVWVMAYTLAEEIGENGLLEVLQSGRDVHTWAARGIARRTHGGLDEDLSDLEWKTEHPELRDRAKPFTFGANYGLTPEGLVQKGMADTVEEAAELLDAYIDTVPGLRQYHQYVRHCIIVDGYLTNKFEQRRHFPSAALLKACRRGYDLEALVREGYAYPIQSGGSTLHSAVHRLTESAPVLIKRDCRPVISVHDSLAFEFHWPSDGYAETTARIIKDLWEQTAAVLPLADGSRLGWQIPVDVKWGRSWGEMTHSLSAKGDLREE